MSSLAAVYPQGQPGNPPAADAIQGRRWELAAILSSLGLVLTVSLGGFALFYLALLAQLLVLAWTVSRIFAPEARRGPRAFKLVLLLISAIASLQAGNALHTITAISSLGQFQQLANQLSTRLEQEGQHRIDLDRPEAKVLRASAVREDSGDVRVDLTLGFGRYLAYLPGSGPIDNTSCYRHLRGAWYQYSDCMGSEEAPRDILSF